jgi:hypothetical protein
VEKKQQLEERKQKSGDDSVQASLSCRAVLATGVGGVGQEDRQRRAAVTYGTNFNRVELNTRWM